MQLVLRWWWMMDCIRICEQLGCYVDEALSADERRAVEAHLAKCSSCADEVTDLRRLAEGLRVEDDAPAPENLWRSIEARLDQADREAATLGERGEGRSNPRTLFRRPLAAAASLLLVIGLGVVGLVWLQSTTPRAEAVTIDFGMLLDGLSGDARNAMAAFFSRYSAQAISADEAHRLAPGLDFEIPESLPYGYRRTAVRLLRFSDASGIAAEYTTAEGDFLAALFHKPILREDYGTHRDYPCVVGKHRGHSVAVGDWRLVHLTDSSTCHCVLSRLDPNRELPAVMSAVAPRTELVSESHADHTHD